MSSKLTIEPCNRKKHYLSNQLKYALIRRNSRSTFDGWYVNENDLSYFEGLRDAGIEDAQIVIDMINLYGECAIIRNFYDH